MGDTDEEPLPQISMPAVSRHLKVLERDAGRRPQELVYRAFTDSILAQAVAGDHQV